jgi:hypothetical protein
MEKSVIKSGAFLKLEYFHNEARKSPSCAVGTLIGDSFVSPYFRKQAAARTPFAGNAT